MRKLEEAELSCVRLEMNSPGQLGTREDASCELRGERVNIVTFPADVPAERWVRSAQQVAGGIYLVGNGWAIGTETEGLAKIISWKLGGKVA